MSSKSGGVSESAEVAVTNGGGCRGRRRAEFWRNVVRQFNFTREGERALLISLTGGVDWMRLRALPHDFVGRHREIYHLIAHGEYARSGTIQRDVTRTFSIFERNKLSDCDLEAQHGALLRVLNAIAEAEDGYCQGMNFIAALFLVEGLEEADAYALFLYLLRKRHFARIFHRSSTFLDEYLRQFELMFRRTLPDLFKHMDAQGFSIPMFGIEWFTTLFSLSTKLDLACAVFDMFFVGVSDIFLRTGLAILKLLEAKLMCMTFEDFLREFKPWVRQMDPYQVVIQALEFPPNNLSSDEDTATTISRSLCLQSTSTSILTVSSSSSSSVVSTPPRSFDLHRTLPPDLAEGIRSSKFAAVRQLWEQFVRRRPLLPHCRVLANEILHFAIWYGRASIACFAIECCGADVDNSDDTNLTPLHFSVVRNEPDMVRLLLAYGADDSKLGGVWSGSLEGLTPLETARNWRFRDTTAARLVLEEEVCLCCNSRFDKLTFESDTCARCKFKYCCRPHALCIDTHQCPSEFWRRRARFSPSKSLATILGEESGQYDNQRHDSSVDDEDSQCSASDTTKAPTLDDYDRPGCEGNNACAMSDSEMGMTRTTSESSSIVFVSSPSTHESIQTPRSRSTSSSASPLGRDHGLRLSGWLRNLSLPSPSSSSVGGSVHTTHSTDDGANTRHRRDLHTLGLQFPDRPQWYCNSPGCHAVFAFFTHALECETCGSFFCSGDFDAKTRRCVRCLEAAATH